MKPNAHITDQIRHWLDRDQPRLLPSTAVGIRPRDRGNLVCPSQSETQATIAVQPHATAGGEIDLRRSEVDRSTSADVRLMGHCRSTMCAYWNDACQLGILVAGSSPLGQQVLECDVRENCRWYLENGRTACANCSAITYLMQHSSDDRRRPPSCATGH